VILSFDSVTRREFEFGRSNGSAGTSSEQIKRHKHDSITHEHRIAVSTLSFYVSRSQVRRAFVWRSFSTWLLRLTRTTSTAAETTAASRGQALHPHQNQTERISTQAATLRAFERELRHSSASEHAWHTAACTSAADLR
jgi:creatinine amidohydrolase/Fe(II)-dependent formamide hydrolase-like protein